MQLEEFCIVRIVYLIKLSLSEVFCVFRFQFNLLTSINFEKLTFLERKFLFKNYLCLNSEKKTAIQSVL